MPVMPGHANMFPDPNLADAEGLVAVGGDLSVERLLAAYRQGIFPWTAQPFTWWSPDPRGIIELDRFHVPRSLDRVICRGTFTVTRNQAFAEVIKNCAAAGPDALESGLRPNSSRPTASCIGRVMPTVSSAGREANWREEFTA